VLTPELTPELNTEVKTELNPVFKVIHCLNNYYSSFTHSDRVRLD